MNPYELLDCQTCGKCCGHKVKHVLPGEAAASSVKTSLLIPFVLIENNPNDDFCKHFVTGLPEGKVGCSVHDADNYSHTCKWYPFNIVDGEITLSVTCTRYTRVIDKMVTDPDYRQAIKSLRVDMLRKLPDEYLEHFNDLGKKYSVNVVLKP